MQRRTPHVELRITGELDIATAPMLVAHAEAAMAEGCRILTIDLNSVTFMDAKAIGALIGIQKQLRSHRGTLELVCESQVPMRVLKLTQVTSAFNIRPADSSPPTVRAIPDPS